MWKEYSTGYIRNNKASGISICAAALISSLLLSLLCGLFFNIWQDEIRGIILEEGDWQGRITGKFDEADLITIRNFANVERAVVNEELSGAGETVVDLYFQNARTIFRDLPLITEKLGLEKSAAQYHLLLLSRYLIHDPQDENPPLLLTFYLVILVLVSVSLILIIHNSFAVSMDARIHQFGIFSSVGATPGQIRACLLQEAAMLCAAPVLLGSSLGIVLCLGVVRAANLLTAAMPGRHEAVFCYHPLVFAVTILFSGLTVLFSAWLPARKLSRMTPLEAIRNTGELRLKKKKRSGLLAVLFGVEGELAHAALKAQKKALRTSALSLTLSFLGFTIMLCFFTLSDISTNHTYFEKYQDVWDVMVTVKDTRPEAFGLTEELRGLQGVQSCVVYQKAAAACEIGEADISEELRALGGPEAVAGDAVGVEKRFYRVQAPVIILDDGGFAAYCEQIGVSPRLDGTVVFNRIWDSRNSNFRYRSYVPYIEENRTTIRLQSAQGEGDGLEVPVVAYTQEAPALREEYADYTLVQFIPLSLWEKIAGQLGDAESDITVCILAKEGTSLAEMNALEEEIAQMVGMQYEAETENRLQEKAANDAMIWGYKVILGGLCVLLAVIGIANVFSNTLGFLRQRKREFARYMSVGMTPAQMRRMFCVEALVIAGRPLLITLPLTIAAVGFMIKASDLESMEFVIQAPIVPVGVFCLFIFGFVALAYYIGARRLLQCSLSDALRNDTMM